MSIKVRWVALAAALFVLSLIVTVQKPQDAKVPIDIQRVARKYTAAVGGWARLMNISSREIDGTFEYKGVEQYF
jgi:hypothetical protein